MKNRFRRRAVIFVLLWATLWVPGCGKSDVKTDGEATPRPEHVQSEAEAGYQDVDAAIKALGILQPAQTLKLGFAGSGPVRSVSAQMGVAVMAGDVLAELDTTALEFELLRAGESVSLRQAALDGLLNGPNPALVKQAEVESAQQVAQAEIALQMARWRLEEARTQQEGEQEAHMLAVALAQSNAGQLDLQLAQASVQTLAEPVTIAQVNLTRAQDALITAQAEHLKAQDRPWEPQEVRDAYARVVRRAEQEVELAQARFESALNAQHAHALGLEVLASQRHAAAMQLTQTLNAQVVHTATFAILEAEVDLAKLQLDGLQVWRNPYLDPPPSAEITQARALLRQAELTVEELEWQLRGAQLRAPFDGAVSAVYLRPGEWGAAGVPVVEIIDTSGWRIETRNVGELTIGRVRLGMEASVHLNAFLGEELRGRVVAISPTSVVQQGDTTYTLTIELEPTDLNLRAGMTAQLEIRTE